MDVKASKHLVWPCYTVECTEKTEGYPTITNIHHPHLDCLVVEGASGDDVCE
jgi:hypothetical protein